MYGTEVLVNVINEHGALPTRNHQQTVFDEAENISGETLTETRLGRQQSLFLLHHCLWAGQYSAGRGFVEILGHYQSAELENRRRGAPSTKRPGPWARSAA